MPLFVPWVLFAVPAVVVAVCWYKLAVGWQSESHTAAGVACLMFVSSAVLLAFAALSWTQFVRPIPQSNYSVERYGLLLSVCAIVAGFTIRQKHRQRYFGLALAAAAWTFMLFFLAASTY